MDFMNTLNPTTAQPVDDGINWNALNEDATAAVSTSKYDTNQRTVFFKCKPGMHQLRIIPVGNRLMKLPYLKLVQHSIPSVTQEGKRTTTFAMCWTHLMEDLLSKKTAEEKKNNSYISYLYGLGKLDQENMDLYQKYGCPFCKAFEHMDRMGVSKEVKNAVYAKTQYLMNVYWRQTQASGDNTIYVWGASKTHFNTIINFVKLCKDAGKNALDINAGHDFILTATGEGFGGTNGRRYSVQFHPIGSPVNVGEQVPFDLAEIGAQSFRPYQDNINLVKYGHGKLLSELGFTFGGDAMTQGFQVPSAIDQVIPPKPEAPEPVVQDGTYTKDGMLYDARTHRPLF